MTIDRCEPDLKGHQSDFLFERYADSIIDVTWVQNLLLHLGLLLGRGEMSGLNNSTIGRFP